MCLITALSIFAVTNLCRGDSLSLTGFGWELFSPSVSKSDIWKLSNVTLPGDVYLSLYENGKIADPYRRDNDVQLRWISYQNWTYQRQIDFSSIDKKGIVLVVQNLDTVADIFVNEIQIGGTSNAFRTYNFDIRSSIRRGTNQLRIDFASPVNYSRDQSLEHKKLYNYSVPVDCHPKIEHGECYANFIRKMHSHFGWDWGPAFPTMGLNGDLKIESFDNCFFKSMSVVPLLDKAIWNLHTEFWLYCHQESIGQRVNLRISNQELNLNYSWIDQIDRKGINRFYKKVPISREAKIDLWWPNGLGDQTLYEIDGDFNLGDEADTKKLLIGFRRVDLIQESIPDFVNGSTFFLNINDVPVFLKGSNWIPGDSFLTRLTDDRLLFYFESMREANMNCIRVWGGGVYETDRFYELADRYGIALWHDMMFAVDLYPATDEFLKNVESEIDDQINRLKHHPSIVIWAGNNENELGMADGWFPMDAPKEIYKRDYLALYNTTIYGVINRTDFQSRPYVFSSPSNGIETVRQGGLSANPGDNRYGDVHFYSYYGDAWDWTKYPKPRCVTEFGYQSFPSIETLRSGLTDGDLHYFSPQMLHRQHHPVGELELLAEMTRQFKFFGALGYDGKGKLGKAMPKFANIVYLSQIHQAMAYKTEVEHYRRWRSMLDEGGEGLTMCALYWQLNDIWQAPTWSSIDYGLKWKAAHYLARRFFAPVLVSPYVDGENLKIVLVNDRNEDYETVTVVLDTLWWTKLSPLYQTNITVSKLKRVSSMLIYESSLDSFRQSASSMANGEDVPILFNTRIFDNKNRLLGPNNILIPDKLRDIGTDNFGKVAIENVVEEESPVAKHVFKVKLVANKVSPFVWLDVEGVRGYFSDNAFTMVDKECEVRFTSWDEISLESVKKNLTVTTLGDLYRNQISKSKANRI